MAATGKSTHTKLDNTLGNNKIVSILYGHPADYIVWPNTKVIIHGKEYYTDVTKAFMKGAYNSEKKILHIPGGHYMSDHHRLNIVKENMNEEEEASLKNGTPGQIYKEIILVREDGTREHYSKFDAVTIQY